MHRIMIVEGNQDVGELILRAIHQLEEYDVAVVYHDASEALNNLRMINPNIMFINVLLKGMTGIKLANLIKEKHPEIKIILMSDDVRYAQECYEVGAERFIAKPFQKEDILSVFESVDENLLCQ